MKLYVTYGMGSKLGKNYSVVEGLDYAICRRMVEAGTNREFAFDYTEEEFAGQPEKYGLTEVPLQPQGPCE
jgi:hypothetical protein